MARVYYQDDIGNGMSASALYSKPLAETAAYVQSTVGDYIQAIGDYTSPLVKNIQDRVSEITSVAAMSQLHNMRNMLNSAWLGDSIRKLNTIDDIRHAPDTMVRWVMAAPVLRDRHLAGGLESYGDRYVDAFPDQPSGMEHYDYRRVTNGVWLKDGDGVKCTVVHERIYTDSDLLSALEKATIMDTWGRVKKHIESGNNSDPTSVWNATM